MITITKGKPINFFNPKKKKSSAGTLYKHLNCNKFFFSYNEKIERREGTGIRETRKVVVTSVHSSIPYISNEAANAHDRHQI